MLLEKEAGGVMVVSDWGRRALRAVLSLYSGQTTTAQGRCPGPLCLLGAPPSFSYASPERRPAPGMGQERLGHPPACPFTTPAHLAGHGALQGPSAADRRSSSAVLQGDAGLGPGAASSLPAALSRHLSGLGGQGCWSDHGHCPVCLLGSRCGARAGLPFLPPRSSSVPSGLSLHLHLCSDPCFLP